MTAGSAGRIDLMLDVLNLLNDAAAEVVVADNITAATFARPKLFIDPRRAMLGVPFNFGR